MTLAQLESRRRHYAEIFDVDRVVRPESYHLETKLGRYKFELDYKGLKGFFAGMVEFYAMNFDYSTDLLFQRQEVYSEAEGKIRARKYDHAGLDGRYVYRVMVKAEQIPLED